MPHRPPDPAADPARLRHVVAHAAHLLPAQGPITVFIHHNTLHAFEDLPFDEAVVKGAKVFGCQPYLSKDRFRAEFRCATRTVSSPISTWMPSGGGVPALSCWPERARAPC